MYSFIKASFNIRLLASNFRQLRNGRIKWERSYLLSLFVDDISCNERMRNIGWISGSSSNQWDLICKSIDASDILRNAGAILTIGSCAYFCSAWWCSFSFAKVRVPLYVRMLHSWIGDRLVPVDYPSLSLLYCNNFSSPFRNHEVPILLPTHSRLSF